MTERLYYTSDMLECTAQVLRCDQQADGRYAIVLDKTVFHPQGGGQPADKGWIAGIPVESVLQQGDDVVHIWRSLWRQMRSDYKSMLCVVHCMRVCIPPGM
jgi:Ser-tRNA(Ala) deacylase AlaX